MGWLQTINDTEIYLFPWRYKSWAKQIPFLHVWRLHACFWKMGRTGRCWLPNVSIHYHKPNGPPGIIKP